MTHPPILTPQQAAKRLGVSEGRVHQFCKAKRLGERLGRRWIIFEDDLERFAAIDRPTGVGFEQTQRG